jgi:hypothetical protein
MVIISLLTIPSISAIEYQEITKEYKSINNDESKTWIETIQSKINQPIKQLINEKTSDFFQNKEHFRTKIMNFIKANGNFSSFDLIMALVGTLIFFILTQPIFLQLIVERGNDFTFIVLLLSLIIIEIGQKYFSLKVIGVWDDYIVNDIDGFWNFFSIVFFSIYFKIYLSYLPTFIIQYSTVLVKAVFYILMFAIPILFNFFIADSIDLIDWNGDERPMANSI